MNTLRASRCTLEPQVAAHATEMFAVLSDPVIYEFENEPPQSEAWLTQRYERLETRASADGSEKWLNWVVRLPSGELAGYVQATVMQAGAALVAYGVSLCVAVLKRANCRSLALLLAVGFSVASPEPGERYGAEPEEVVMVR